MAARSITVGVADHLGWAVLVTVAADLGVLDRRRIELVGPDLPAAPVHHLGGAWEMHGTGDPLTDEQLAAQVAAVRDSARSTIDAELDRLAADIDGVAGLALRSWPADFPTEIAAQRKVPHESRADPIMYRQELAAAAARRGWVVATYDARSVETDARARFGAAADDPLGAPRRLLGAPWSKDHRLAYAAAVAARPGPT